MSAALALVAQLALGLVFLASAAAKLRAPAAFARGVAGYDVLPRGLAVLAGYALIPAEAFLALAHLSGWLLPLGARLGLATLAAFALGVAVNLKRGRGLPCLCFSAQGGELLSGRSLARLALLIAGEVLVLVNAGPWNGPAGPLLLSGRTPAELANSLLLALFALCAGFWLLRLPDLLYIVKGCAACARDLALDGPPEVHP